MTALTKCIVYQNLLLDPVAESVKQNIEGFADECGVERVLKRHLELQQAENRPALNFQRLNRSFSSRHRCRGRSQPSRIWTISQDASTATVNFPKLVPLQGTGHHVVEKKNSNIVSHTRCHLLKNQQKDRLNQKRSVVSRTTSLGSRSPNTAMKCNIYLK